jgi:hypothetical protein
VTTGLVPRAPNRIVTTATERAANFACRGADRGLADDDVRPDGSNDFLTAHQATVVTDQMHEKRQGLGLNRHRRAGLAEGKSFLIEFELCESPGSKRTRH